MLYDLVTLDTSNPASVTQGLPAVPVGATLPAGMIGSRSANGSGGTVSLVSTVAVGPPTCTTPPRCPSTLRFLPVVVPNAGAPTAQATRDQTADVAAPFRTLGFGSLLSGGPEDLVV